MKAMTRCGSGWAVVAVVVGSVAVGVGAVQAKTVYVSTAGDDGNDGLGWGTAKRTVQAGINAAGGWDQVWVAAGVYVENIRLKMWVGLYGGFAGDETGLGQRNWATNVTVLDGNQAGSVVSVYETGTSPTRIDGFTIRNGGESLVGGGGIYCTGSSPTIANCIITGNSSLCFGGGILCLQLSSPTIIHNTITDNIVSMHGYSGGAGGGIYCTGGSPTIANNIIMGNVATGEGGGIFCYNGSPVIANNRITGNRADFGGGGINCAGNVILANNTIAGNRGDFGGGVYCGYGSTTIVNTIVAFNSSGIHKISTSGTVSLRRNCIYANATCDYSGLDDPAGAYGNISADPLFASASAGADGMWGTADDALDDLRLLPWSPCIDAGGNADVPADAADLDGDRDLTERLPVGLNGGARFLDDPQVADTGDGTGPIVDMGAYERKRPVGDVDGDWMTDVVDVLYLAEAFGKSSGDEGFDGRCDFDGNGAVDVADLMVMVEGFGK